MPEATGGGHPRFLLIKQKQWKAVAEIQNGFFMNL